MAETPAHRNLKRAALAFLLLQGCAAVAVEVRCPIQRYVIDAAGYADVVPHIHGVQPSPPGTDEQPLRAPAGPRTAPATWMVECKRERGDFLRDSARRERLLAERDELLAKRTVLEETWIKRQEPHLRRTGASLFAECEEWDFASTKLTSYHEILRELRKLERQLTGTTKFCMLAHYRLADWLYIAAPAGLLSRHDLPAGWGLLEWTGPGVTAAQEHVATPAPATPLRVSVPAPQRPGGTRTELRVRLLRNIAVAATRTALRQANDPVL